MKALKYPTTAHLRRDQVRLIANNYDDWNLVTGRVGNGKSKWARKLCRKLDPLGKKDPYGFWLLDRIHFSEEAFWDDYENRAPGDVIILDEFRGHRRAAMHGDRIDFLMEMKEKRARRVHAFIVYDRVASLDRDLLTDRNAYWHHIEQRGRVQVRQPYTTLKFRPDTKRGVEPIEPTKYPLVGDFKGFTAIEPAGFEEAYEAKKKRMTAHRDDDGERAPAWRRGPAAPDPRLVDLAARELGLFRP